MHSPLPPVAHQLLITAFAGWMLLCCCEKRWLSSIAAPDREAPACCAHCCADSDANDGGGSPQGPHECTDGCCVKSAAAVPAFDLRIDEVGAPIADTMLAAWESGPDAGIGAAEGSAPWLARPPDPPPRLALLLTARLRI